jgi:hypothetical protein
MQVDRQSMQNVGSASQHGNASKVHIWSVAGEKPAANVTTVHDTNWAPPDCQCASSPVLSPNSTEMTAGSIVTITSPSPNAVIYYTTDGWTPTAASTRYNGPIPIQTTATLQVIAEEPDKAPSPIVRASYVVNSPASVLPQDTIAVNGVLAKGTLLRMMTASKVSSEAANVGEYVSVLLDENLIVDGKVIAQRGMSADAAITAVERSGPGGLSGMIVFQVKSINVHGVSVPLNTKLTLLGPDVASEAYKVANPSMVHIAGPLPHGNEAVIRPGMGLTAVVAADTTLHP